MFNYIIKRLLALIPILIGVAIIVFLIVHLIPGDPAQTMLGERATDQALERLREQMGLNDPLPVQFWRYVKDLLRGDLGRSIMSNNPVSAELVQRFPATLELSFFAIIFAVFVGVPAGIFASMNQNSWFDNLSMLIALIGVSMPIFWLGLMFIWLFAVELGWFPPSSRIGVGLEFTPITNLYVIDSILQFNFTALKNVLHHLVLPAVALGTIPMAIIARMTRSSMLEVLKKDYIRTAYAKGLKRKIVIFKHALKNAMVPIITVVGLQFGVLLGGAVMTETIFSWPGLGKYLVDAIYARDFPIVQGGILFFAGVFVIVNLIVDLSYALVDPRIQYE
ncbi:peptide/nickel transport system permease protein [Halanaerobium congolense]|jgi:peptide/nickel transport system permease protein|uniref:Peptide/nickel transport system permease protein n=1 Tax=Halanaerobium congolense TaxID=54121 RepID=A0A1G6HP16_9FIRM|nr:ABC transporter permease [Halanaerobium congolense]KXS49861.1 MAG: peptide/nickel transport system permease protein [Halanaerobium sp. T82-1]OEG63088.1 MAG: peptide ABC transporter permease [Halanaerobium sp. MDAL1]PUU91227.1 MAG: peptide/nickel transport system permease protein [Halanaerobium sp.]PTX16883.1 peptide/nickel transport system permease protein [Halanaerobium congolense]PXV69954.1 peptide/nickel transport system permease protein [Halanaerobium congolense]